MTAAVTVVEPLVEVPLEAPVVKKPGRVLGVVETERKLARIVLVDDVVKHTNADALEIALVGGWQCVTKIGEFKKGDRAVYCEIDSLLPIDYPSFNFLEARGSENKLVGDKPFHRLKSMKLRKELSQGLLIPVPKQFKDAPVDTNVTLELGILKYVPKPANGENISDEEVTWYTKLAQQILGGLDRPFKPWPAKLSRSSQERIQNRSVVFNKAKESKEEFEISVKLNGSSMTVFNIKEDDNSCFGICSRDFELDLDESKWSLKNQIRFWVGSFMLRNRMALKYKRIIFPKWQTKKTPPQEYVRTERSQSIMDRLHQYQITTGRYITVQGEMVGPGVQSNYEGLDALDFYVYEDGDKELLPDEAREVTKAMGLKYVPIVETNHVIPEETSIKDVLKSADGKRHFHKDKNTFREGLVYKSTSRIMSFKVISDKYLLKTGD